ncbi:hypothetical protein FHX57_006818 [Paraburkholderia tropica]|uniref:hypothetical protein n=1 Tax=Paraburkholderia tropica TaxID=92647 RepID=UPI00161B7385|nr:hypothetical protein [Paraburkholderia tropica]MBB3004436.1 hypothetical protein [Paraburkholderia tropica]
MAEDALKRYVLTVPEFPDEPYMAEHPAGAWVEHRDYRAMVEKFEVADQELRSYLAEVSDQLIYARRDLAALREDIESQIRIASEEAARADSFGRDTARYRWIRNGHICIGRQSTLLMTGGALDDAIDAAISKEKEQTS